MDAANEKRIYLDRRGGLVVFEPGAWGCDMRYRLMFHIPSGLLFVIEINEAVRRGEVVLNLLEIYAKPLHVYDDRPSPGEEELTSLGREAILLYMKAIGWEPPGEHIPAANAERGYAN